MLKSRRFWLAMGVSLLFLALFLSRIDVKETGRNLREADYALLIPAILVYFGAVLFRTLRWQYLLRPMKALAMGHLYPVVVIGYMANNLLPVRLGEVVRAYYLGEREGISKTATLATIAVERVFDGLTLLFFAAVVSLFLPLVGILQGLGERAGIPWVLLALAMSLPFVLVIVFMVAAASSPTWVERLVDRISALLPAQIRPRAKGLVRMFLEGLDVLKSPRQLLVVFALSMPVWLMEALMYYIIGFSFGLDDSFSLLEMAGVVLLVTAVSNLATSVPTAGGGIGTFEVASAATLTILGVEGAVAGAYTIVLHVALLVPVTLLGLGYLWARNLSLARLTRESRGGTGTLSSAQPEPSMKKEDAE